MRFIPLYSILACIALVFSQTDTSSENLFANQPDNSNLFLDDNSSGGLYSMDPTVPDDGALMHSNPLDAPDDSSLLMNSNLPADVPDNSALLMNPTLLTAADAPNKGCSDPLPAWNKIRARQTSCPNPDDDGVVLEGKKSILTDEEVKKHWCPEASGPFRGFGNIPVCYRRETFLGPLAGYYPFLENVELSKIYHQPQFFSNLDFLGPLRGGGGEGIRNKEQWTKSKSLT